LFKSVDICKGSFAFFAFSSMKGSSGNTSLPPGSQQFVIATDLYVELAGSWELFYCVLTTNNVMRCYDKEDGVPGTATGDPVLEVR
jgi:hypothetical protein